MGELSLRVSRVTKSYPGTAALIEVGLEAGRGEIHVLLGENGSGKSTLIKILAGVERADAGALEVRGRPIRLDRGHAAESYAAGLRFIHQDLGLFASLTVAENMSLGRGFETARGGRIRWREVASRAERSLRTLGLEVAPETTVSALRPAARSLVAIARALQDCSGDDAVLVLDEPTSSLPPEEVGLLFNTLRQRAAAGATIVLVTHRLSEALSVADRITVLRDGRKLGTFDAAAVDEDELIELITGGARPDRARDERPDRGETMLSAQELAGGGFAGISFEIRTGEILGVAGLGGSGRTRLLRMLFGAAPRGGGEVTVAGRQTTYSTPADAMAQGIVLVPEDRGEAVFPAMSVSNNLVAGRVGDYWRRFRLRHHLERRDASAAIRRCGIITRSESVPIAWLSGGNQQKVVLARWLDCNPRVLLLDEPTRGVDVGARTDLHQLIRDAVLQGACALVASSDLEELTELCDRVIVLAAGRIVTTISRPFDVHRLTEAMVKTSNPIAAGR